MAGKAIPPSPYTYVHNEGVISAGAEQRLSSTLRRFELATHHQFVVALFQSLDGESLEDYSNRVFRSWKVGSAQHSDGLLFALYKNDRKWRVEVGYGLEGVLTDLQAGSIARDQGVPHFKSGDFDGGVQAIADALIAKLQGRDIPAPARAPSLDAHDWVGAIYVIIFLFVIAMTLIQQFMLVTLGPRARDSDWFFIDFTHSGGSSGGGGWGGGGGGGFSGGGGSSGGGGASGGW